MEWLTRAYKASSRGSSLFVALLLHRLSVIHKQQPFKFTDIECKRRGISRHKKYRALAALEKAGLIEIVERRNGANPIVAIKQQKERPVIWPPLWSRLGTWRPQRLETDGPRPGWDAGSGP
jgi:hypothetical protein